MKRALCLVLMVALVLSMGVCAYADSTQPISTEIEYLDNGYYIVTELYVVQTRVQQLTSGSKVMTFTVNGTFKYNGSTCIATQASYDYEILVAGWQLVSGNAYCEDNKAIAEGFFKNILLGTVDTTVTLSCSPTGVLS